jgi:hypothetical protein
MDLSIKLMWQGEKHKYGTKNSSNKPNSVFTTVDEYGVFLAMVEPTTLT